MAMSSVVPTAMGTATTTTIASSRGHHRADPPQVRAHRARESLLCHPSLQELVLPPLRSCIPPPVWLFPLNAPCSRFVSPWQILPHNHPLHHFPCGLRAPQMVGPRLPTQACYLL